MADGEKHVVCLIKNEGKPSLSRELSKLFMRDPFMARGAEHAVRVVVTSPGGAYHVGWRGIVVKASTPNVKVFFPYLSAGRVAHATMSVPRQHLRLLAEDDVVMTPNKHPWIARRVQAQTGQVGEIVHVSSKGRVKVALEGPQKRKRTLFVESTGASFEALFIEVPAEVAQVPPQPHVEEVEPQVPPQLAAEVEAQIDPPQLIADSDAESEGGPTPPQDNDEPTAMAVVAPKKRGDAKKVKAVVKKRPAASTLGPAPNRRRKATGDDVD